MKALRAEGIAVAAEGAAFNLLLCWTERER